MVAWTCRREANARNRGRWRPAAGEPFEPVSVTIGLPGLDVVARARCVPVASASELGSSAKPRRRGAARRGARGPSRRGPGGAKTEILAESERKMLYLHYPGNPPGAPTTR